ncbi:MAG: hypothetical protein ACTHV8_11480, partial [Nesterenkonia sp.]
MPHGNSLGLAAAPLWPIPLAEPSSQPNLLSDHPDLAIFGVDEPHEPRTLIDIFQQAVALNAGAVALEGTDQTLTGELRSL